MLPNSSFSITIQRIQHANRKGRSSQRINLPSRNPSERPRFVSSHRTSASAAAAKDERYNAALHILIHSSEQLRLNLKPCLFPDFSFKATENIFVCFEDAPRRFPMTVVSALYQQRPGLIIHDDAGDAHRVARVVIHHSPSAG